MDRMPSQLYRMHSINVPRKIKNDTIVQAFIKLSSYDYIAISYDYTKYINFNRDRRHLCITTHYANIYLILGAFRNVPESEDCEINLLLNPSMKAITSCDVQ